MTDPRWARLETLFDGALARPAAARAAWLAEACPDDEPLRAQVARMLAAHATQGILDRPLVPPDLPDLRAAVERALAGRYTIGETLGTGGMAAVFLAHERKHDRRVVLKVLQPGLAAAIGPERFRDEVRIAALLAHPHILPLIDSGDADGLLYYVMPYVGGGTLRERLGAGTPLPLAEAVTLLRDIADALAHAHAAGVVHRDLKPENVLVVGAHAFLLDFGVAKLTQAAGETATHPGLAIGTPGYMAPEQAAAQPVDRRADIYVWGVLAREVLTGSRHPEVQIAARRPDVPRTLVALVEACLAVDPAERPPQASSLVAALDGLVAPARERRRWPRIALAATVAVAAMGAWRYFTPSMPTGGLVLPVAVMPLTDETGDSTLAGWGRLAGDWITQGLHQTGMLRVVPWPDALLASEHHRTLGAAAQNTSLGETVREETGARTLVSGSYYLTGDTIRLQATITDIATGSLLAATPPVVAHRDSAAAALGLLRERVMGAIAIGVDQKFLPATTIAGRPPTYEAYRAFDRGLEAYHRYQYEPARDALLDAWARDTTFYPALLYAAYAALNMSDVEGTDSLVRRVLGHRDLLSEFHVALAENLQALLAGDRQRALQATLRASEVAPGSRAPYHAAQIQLQLNHPAAAESLLAGMDPDHGPMRVWPAYWSQRAYAAHLLARHERERAFARTMRGRHPEQRVTWVIEARALGAEGRTASLDSLLRTADTLAPDVYWSQGAMRVVAAEELVAHGFAGQAVRYFADGERWLKARLVQDPGSIPHREWLGSALIGQGKWTEAETLFLALMEEQPRLRHRGPAAVLAARRGDLALANRRLGSDPPYLAGEQLMYRARIAAVSGDRGRALALLTDAVRTGVDNLHWIHGNAGRDFLALAADPKYKALVGLK